METLYVQEARPKGHILCDFIYMKCLSSIEKSIEIGIRLVIARAEGRKKGGRAAEGETLLPGVTSTM